MPKQPIIPQSAIPNEQTKQAIAESFNADKLRRYETTAELYADLGI